MRNFWEAVGAVLGAIISLVSLPLMILNLFGGIVAGIWLIVLGHWVQFGLGIGILIGGSTLLGLIIMPSIPFEMGGMALMKKGRAFLGMPLILAGGLWIYFVIYMWCGFTFATMVGMAEGHMVPSALWGYANAVGPWGYMASKGAKEETGSMLSVFAAQLGCVAMMFGVLFRGATPDAAGLVPYLFPFIALGVLMHLALGITLAVAAKKEGEALFA